VRVVLDTNTLYAGIRSSRGASRVIVELITEDWLVAVLTPALFLEYEERLRGDVALHALGLTDAELSAFLDEMAAKSHCVRVDIRWRPVSPDPDDDMVIECAVNGRADVLITFNIRDLRVAQERFGIFVLTPREFLRRYGSRL
jgi:putative PIN family toxin of toxin-antitoxin system